MAKMGEIQNGLKKRRTHKRRKNSLTAAKVSNPARRSVSLSTAKSIIKKNGLKAVSLKANGHKKHRRKRRNGLAVVSTRRNGFFGNTKGDAKQVLALAGGALGVKAVGRAVSAIIAPFLSQVGVGAYAEIITDAGLALFIAPFVGGKIGGAEGAKMARLGGLLTVALDGVEIFAPNFLSFNPFNTSPVVMTQGGAAVAPHAVAQLAQDVANSSNPHAAAANVAGVMAQLDTAGAQGGYGGGNYMSGVSPELVV